jgi:outer membrane receptor protein involved in Fe transport
MTSKKIIISILLSSLGISIVLADEVILDPIIVGADFHVKRLAESTTSLALMGEESLYDKSFQTLEEILGQVPNVNFSSGASRAHHIQIRGIGERSQFTTSINPSVAIVMDGIEYSQSSLGVTLFDTKQIEILKGPQGTAFGASAMAGLVNIQSNGPSEELEGHLESTLGTYNTQSYGLAVSGSLIDEVLEGRLSIFKQSSDGYMKNSFLGRDDTQNIDELTAKLQLHWYISDKHIVDIDIRHVNINNGYDAFTLDNTRESHSDQVGKDTQKSNAIAIKSSYQITPAMHLIYKLSHSNSDSLYAYDEDWSFVGEFDESTSPYSAFDSYARNRIQSDIDIRLVSDASGRVFNDSTDWLFGIYSKVYDENLRREYSYFDEAFKSLYETTSQAIYGELDTAITEKLTLVSGLRVESWHLKYSDSNSVTIKNDEILVGGKIGFNYEAIPNRLYYAYLSRGYKPAGVNADPSLIPEAKIYERENLWNLELGLNSMHLDDTLINRFNIFYGKREEQQVKSSVVTVREDGSSSFVGYLTNAAESHYYGLESQLDWYPNERIHLYSSVGLLYSSFDTYTDPNPSSIDVTGRSPAHSPKYQYNFGLDMTFWEGWIWKSNIEGKGAYYFSNRHNERSDAYVLLHSSLEYTIGSWSIVAWMRNIANTDYETRGFGSFGNNPSKGYEIEGYTQQGTPRTAGLTLSYDF